MRNKILITLSLFTFLIIISACEKNEMNDTGNLVPLTEGWYDTRSGYRCNYYINEWQGMWDASYPFDFTTGLDKFTTEILFIVGTTERLGKEYQETYHTKYFNLYEGSTFTLEGADHFQLILSDKTVPKIREYFNLN